MTVLLFISSRPTFCPPEQRNLKSVCLEISLASPYSRIGRRQCYLHVFVLPSSCNAFNPQSVKKIPRTKLLNTKTISYHITSLDDTYIFSSNTGYSSGFIIGTICLSLFSVNSHLKHTALDEFSF